MPPNNSLKSKITWTFNRLSSNRLLRSNSDVERLRFHELRGKFRNKRTNNKALVKLIECIMLHNIGKVWTRWLKSRVCNRVGSSKVGRWGLKRLERIIRGCNSHNIQSKTLFSSSHKSQLLTILITLSKMMTYYFKTGRSSGLMSKDWQLCRPPWDLSTLLIWTKIQKQMTFLRKQNQRRLIDVWWIRLHSLKHKYWPWVTVFSNLRSKRRRMRVSSSCFRPEWDTSRKRSLMANPKLMATKIRRDLVFSSTMVMHRMIRMVKI